ncbi:hypothetical protein ACWEQ2_38350 [Streptomyces sp. NPDC004096]
MTTGAPRTPVGKHLTGYTHPVYAVAFSPDSSVLAAAHQEQVLLYAQVSTDEWSPHHRAQSSVTVTGITVTAKEP